MDGENTLSLLQASLNSQEQFFLGDLFVLVYIHNVHDFFGISLCNALALAYLRKDILDDPQKLSQFEGPGIVSVVLFEDLFNCYSDLLVGGIDGIHYFYYCSVVRPTHQLILQMKSKLRAGCEPLGYPIYIPLAESEFLRKVAKTESRQLDHFVRSKLMSNDRECRCSNSKQTTSPPKGPQHSHNSKSRSRSPPALTYQHSSPNLYSSLNERLNEKLQLQRESLAKKHRLKTLYIEQLEKHRQEHRAESKKKRNNKFKQNYRNREEIEREERRKSEELVRRRKERELRLKGWVDAKERDLKEADKIRREIDKKKGELAEKIQTLQDQGLDSGSILSILSIESMFTGHKLPMKSSSTGLLSNRNLRGSENLNSINTQRNSQKVRTSEYFTSTSKGKKKNGDGHKNGRNGKK